MTVLEGKRRKRRLNQRREDETRRVQNNALSTWNRNESPSQRSGRLVVEESSFASATATNYNGLVQHPGISSTTRKNATSTPPLRPLRRTFLGNPSSLQACTLNPCSGGSSSSSSCIVYNEKVYCGCIDDDDTMNTNLGYVHGFAGDHKCPGNSSNPKRSDGFLNVSSSMSLCKDNPCRNGVECLPFGIPYCRYNCDDGRDYIPFEEDCPVATRSTSTSTYNVMASSSLPQAKLLNVEMNQYLYLLLLVPVILLAICLYCCCRERKPSERTQRRKEASRKGRGGSFFGGKTVVRSTIECTAICCAYEIHMIEEVLKPLPGIEKIMINTTFKRVIVDHDVTETTASDIERVLNENSFGASILVNGGADYERTTAKSSSRRRRTGGGYVCQFIEHDDATVKSHGSVGSVGSTGSAGSVGGGGTAASATIFGTSIFTLGVGVICDHPMEVKLIGFLQTFSRKEISNFAVHVNSGQLTIVHNPLLLPAEDIARKMEERTGIELQLVINGNDSIIWEFPQVSSNYLQRKEAIQKEKDLAFARLRPYVIWSGFFLIISLLSYIGGNWVYLEYVALLSVAIGIPPIATKAFRSLLRLQFGSHSLMILAIFGALAIQEYHEAAAVTFLFVLSEWLENRAMAKTRKVLSDIIQQRPETANLIHPKSGELIIVPATAVPVGALVSVRTGCIIPCDGVVVEGSSAVNESSLTGESTPVMKLESDAVSGGTINSGNARLTIQTTATADESAVAQLVKLLEEAQTNRSATEMRVDKFARVYTPLVVLAAILMCTIPWAVDPEIGPKWVHNGLVLIIIACPCALIISTPVAYAAGLAATAQKGILVKGGAYLEALGLTRKVCFDKTGTVTQGKFQVHHLNVIGETKSRPEMLGILSLMEERASHPLGKALVDAAKQEGVRSPEGMYVKDFMMLPGEGVSGEVNDMTVHVGNRRLFQRLNLYGDTPSSEKDQALEWEANGGTVGFMSIENVGIVCSYCVTDTVRPEAQDVVKRFDNMGIDVFMLTGDNRGAAKAIGKEIGLEGDSIKSHLLPEDKVALVKEIKDDQGGHKRLVVLMCGDGVNDAPAFAASDVGVAMGDGATLAMETADVTLLESSLEKLVYSVNIGRRVIWKIKQNISFSIIVKLLVVGFAVAGKISLWGAIASDVGAMILVTLNGMLLLPSEKPRKPASPTNNDVETG